LAANEREPNLMSAQAEHDMKTLEAVQAQHGDALNSGSAYALLQNRRARLTFSVTNNYRRAEYINTILDPDLATMQNRYVVIISAMMSENANRPSMARTEVVARAALRTSMDALWKDSAKELDRFLAALLWQIQIRPKLS
jgi:hypothetical protein